MEILILAFLVFVLIGIATAYSESGFLGSLFWAPALAFFIAISGAYILVISGGVTAVVAGINGIGKIVSGVK